MTTEEIDEQAWKLYRQDQGDNFNHDLSFDDLPDDTKFRYRTEVILMLDSTQKPYIIER